MKAKKAIGKVQDGSAGESVRKRVGAVKKGLQKGTAGAAMSGAGIGLAAGVGAGDYKERKKTQAQVEKTISAQKAQKARMKKQAGLNAALLTAAGSKQVAKKAKKLAGKAKDSATKAGKHIKRNRETYGLAAGVAAGYSHGKNSAKQGNREYRKDLRKLEREANKE